MAIIGPMSAKQDAGAGPSLGRQARDAVLDPATPRRRAWIWWAVGAYVLALHVALVTLVLRTDFLDRLDRKFIDILPATEFDTTYNRWARGLEGSDENARPGALLFIGDSLMRDLDTSSIARHTLNLAIPGDTTAGVLRRMSSYQSLTTARGLVLGVGINDAAHRPVTEALGNYRRILGLAPRDVPVIILSVLPIDARVLPGDRNDYAVRLNAGLRDLCAARPGCHFTDLASRLTDTSGNLIASAHDGDGIHLSSAGRELYWAAVYQAVERVMPPARVLSPTGGVSSE